MFKSNIQALCDLFALRQKVPNKSFILVSNIQAWHQLNLLGNSTVTNKNIPFDI